MLCSQKELIEHGLLISTFIDIVSTASDAMIRILELMLPPTKEGSRQTRCSHEPLFRAKHRVKVSAGTYLGILQVRLGRVGPWQRYDGVHVGKGKFRLPVPCVCADSKLGTLAFNHKVQGSIGVTFELPSPRLNRIV